jgi:alpha-tubulin suppressor-like RCC1 family protein
MTNPRRMQMAAAGAGDANFLWTAGECSAAGPTIGDGFKIQRSSPTQIGSDSWESVSSMGEYTLAIRTGGALFSWGRNTNGRLGLGDVVARSSPVQIGALTDWAKLATGSDPDQAGAIKTDGTLWMWGLNSEGQLGVGTVIDHSSPVQVGSLTTWESVFFARESSFAIKTDGTMWFIGGKNDGGSGGIAGTSPKSSPVQIGSATDWKQGAAGAVFCAAISDSGKLYTWGNAGDGVLGNNTSAGNISSPVQIGSLTDWSTLNCGRNRTLAVKTDGTLWSFGENYGRLGDGTTANRSSPVQIGALTTWSTAGAGANANLALKTTGELFAWGQASNGASMLNTSDTISSPVQVGTLATWIAVSVGEDNSAIIGPG